jgi:hypothetical protein
MKEFVITMIESDGEKFFWDWFRGGPWIKYPPHGGGHDRRTVLMKRLPALRKQYGSSLTKIQVEEYPTKQD